MIRLLLLLTLSSAIIYSVNACSCVSFPLQDLFCHASFVIKMKVENITAAEDQYGYQYYHVDIIEIFKASEATKAALESKPLKTRADSATCGLSLQKDQVVIVGGYVSGGQPNLNLCGLKIFDSSEMAAQEKNLRENFPKSCA